MLQEYEVQQAVNSADFITHHPDNETKHPIQFDSKAIAMAAYHFGRYMDVYRKGLPVLPGDESDREFMLSGKNRTAQLEDIFLKLAQRSRTGFRVGTAYMNELDIDAFKYTLLRDPQYDSPRNRELYENENFLPTADVVDSAENIFLLKLEPGIRSEMTVRGGALPRRTGAALEPIEWCRKDWPQRFRTARRKAA